MSRVRRSAFRMVSLVAAALLFAGMGLAQQTTKIRVGQVAPIALFWPDFIAQQKGFYATEGLDVDSNFLGSVAAIVQQMIGNSIDIGFTTAETVIRAADKGGDVIILGETVYNGRIPLWQPRTSRSRRTSKEKNHPRGAEAGLCLSVGGVAA